MKTDNHEIHEYENNKIMKTMKSTIEIHELMNLKTRMSKNLWAVWNVWIWNQHLSMKPKTAYIMKQSNTTMDPGYWVFHKFKLATWIPGTRDGTVWEALYSLGLCIFKRFVLRSFFAENNLLFYSNNYF